MSSDVDGVTIDMTNKDHFWLAVNAYHEARGEGFEGMIAVCHVVLNRAKKKNVSVHDVVLRPMQFSWANGGKRPPIGDYAAFERCMDAATEAVRQQGVGKDLFGASHYHAASMKPYPPWAIPANPVTRIGGHIFYRL